MQRLEKRMEELRQKPVHPTDEALVNAIREYLQVRVLQFIFQSKWGASLSFMGGTCLRICYDLKRYSEDLDFALDGEQKRYRFSELLRHVERELQLAGFDVEKKVDEEKIVQKAFLRFRGLYPKFGIRGPRDQKIHIKIEVDVRPVRLAPHERESFFVTRFGEIFPILKHTLPTLFAGKISAILSRSYSKGRDYYDLIWYLTRKTPINLRYLRSGIHHRKFPDEKSVYAALREKIVDAKPEIILKDIGRFLEDPKEADWIRHYRQLFEQLCPE